MNTQPLVSIISGYYNRADFVDESIQSLCDQTYKNIEIIVFDDCSTDNTYEKLKAFEEKDARVKVIRHEKNIGFVNGLINSVNISKGKYVAIHGSGDYSYPKRIERQVEVLEANPSVGAVGVYVDNITYKNNQKIITPYNRNYINNSSNWIIRKLHKFTHGEVMFRKEIYNKVSGYRSYFVFAQDFDLWSRMAVISDFYTIHEVLYERYLRSDGASVSPEKKYRQIFFSEVIRYNIENRLSQGKEDIIKQYGDKTFEHLDKFTYNFVHDLFNLLISVLRSDKRNIKFIKHSVYNFRKYSGKKKITYLLIILYYLPRRLTKRLMSSHKINSLIWNLYSSTK